MHPALPTPGNGRRLHTSSRTKFPARTGIDGEVVLLDRDGLLQHLYEPEPVGPNLWLGWAWMHLFGVDKYLRRGSFREALLKLEEARTLLLRHHAAETRRPDPELGLDGADLRRAA
jgi:hypothetical protein